jgi:hypothetical protein
MLYTAQSVETKSGWLCRMNVEVSDTDALPIEERTLYLPLTEQHG